MDPEILFRVIIIGDTGVGKSCFLLRFSDNNFKEQYDVTIGVEFGSKTISVANKAIKLQIWDTAGQENFRSITRSFYRRADAVLLMYDISNKRSFNNLNDWVREIKENSPKDVMVYLVGNQLDLIDGGMREVTVEEAEKFKNENKIAGFKEASAKSGINVANIFTDICTTLYKQSYERVAEYKNTVKTIDLKPTINPKRKKKRKFC